ncbi:MAG: DNA-3-methyladenine glycosylase [Promethearchaeota archaeon]
MTVNKRLTREFFNRDTELVAIELLGKCLVRKSKEGVIVGKVMEVEAYLGINDKACHSYDSKMTERTKVMYMEPGTFYVYFVYGMYYCLNVITEPKGIPCAILIRQLYPVAGIKWMQKNRNIKIGKNFKNLCDGPGKLCMAMNITKEKFNGSDSCAINSKMYFAEGEEIKNDKITLNKRIGIDYAEEDKDKLLRFSLNIK